MFFKKEYSNVKYLGGYIERRQDHKVIIKALKLETSRSVRSNTKI